MLVEAHDNELLQKIERYIREPIKLRTIDELRPKTKAPKPVTKKKPSQKAKQKNAAKKQEETKKKKVKQRHRDTKNKGKPNKMIIKTE